MAAPTMVAVELVGLASLGLVGMGSEESMSVVAVSVAWVLVGLTSAAVGLVGQVSLGQVETA